MTRLAVALLALVLLAVVLQDAFEVMLLPRRVYRRIRLVRYYFRGGWAIWSWMAGRMQAGIRREHVLSVFGPLSMVMLFALWAIALITGLGMLEWVLQTPGATGHSALSEQIYMSGVTFFTLGYGDVVPHSAAARALSVAEAGSGIGFIAVVIGYLPVLYQLFSRREAHVIRLDGRAGSPPTAVTMLIRHAEGRGLDKLDDLLSDWEVWASELLESHLSYPMLVYYRSQHDNQSWLAALTAVMDTCALILVGLDEMPPLQARMTFTMARQVVVEMAETLRVAPTPFEGFDRLPREGYARLEGLLIGSGLNWTHDAEGVRTLADLRATYEPLLAGLASRLLLPLPGWMAADDAADHWQDGHHGLITSRLIEQLSDRNEAPPTPLRTDGR
nr:potassium channel family protein [uncultured Lichenicoccus sp.]